MTAARYDDDRDDRSTAVRTRGPELAVAGFLFAIAVLVITDSVRVGIGWADDGPRAGYFPFYIGLIMAVASLVTLVQAIVKGLQERRSWVVDDAGRHGIALDSLVSDGCIVSGAEVRARSCSTARASARSRR